MTHEDEPDEIKQETVIIVPSVNINSSYQGNANTTSLHMMIH